MLEPGSCRHGHRRRLRRGKGLANPHDGLPPRL